MKPVALIAVITSATWFYLGLQNASFTPEHWGCTIATSGVAAGTLSSMLQLWRGGQVIRRYFAGAAVCVMLAAALTGGAVIAVSSGENVDNIATLAEMPIWAACAGANVLLGIMWVKVWRRSTHARRA
jgi:hypothetical protein